MIELLFASCITLILGSLAGHFVHWCLHQPFSRQFYISHLNHHLVQYTANNLTSWPKYRSSKIYSGWIWFTPPIAVFIIAIAAALHICGVSDVTVACVVLEAAAIGWLHGWLHDKFHTVRCMSESPRLYSQSWFTRLQWLHFQHHRNVRSNFGIIWFGWDKLFGTFKP